ncbi:hypothetical protein K1T35_47700 (plasmid) [Pseudonocardia sp. DSM 110487]|uniref:hypothetical protein n=1 Tax=Pseudonocardia sp. DSM 110487 TaxID=2865833 RepID=UPI001C6A62C6|nr:hypothetical protein [Pseudonocardia sp. DSM 110487]QYN41036.1 hypothetical protein K1T35_47700 [Pseudonocardia sp. DSM 110487]
MDVEEKQVLAQSVTEWLGLPPRLLRLLSAVHEAGHAIVAHTVDLKVTAAAVASFDTIGLGGDHISISIAAGQFVPAPDILAMRAAGFQASFMWLDGRGIDGNREPYLQALNTLAAGDLNWCTDFSRTVMGRSPMQQHTVPGAYAILSRRWRAVLSLAYALADRGEMTEAQLQPFLCCGPQQQVAAREAYLAWRGETAHLWTAVAA